MFDEMLLLKALAVAFIASAIGTAIGCWHRREPRWTRAEFGAILGTATGFYLGCWWLGHWPSWPMKVDQDRLLIVVLPAAIFVELAAAFPRVPRWSAWTLRLAIAAGMGRILLDHTSYLTDLAGPGTREWTAEKTWLMLGSLALASSTVWVLLALRERRLPSRSVPMVLAIASAGTACTVMLSGYLSGGLLGLPLAGALMGTAVGSLFQKGRADARSPLGFGIVGLFSLVVIGRFFGQLTTAHALGLFFAPLLVWLPEFPYIRRLRPWLRGLLACILVAIPVMIVVAQAKRAFDEDSKPVVAPGGDAEPSLDDYLNFRP